MPRVLIGDFGGVTRLGLRECLREEGVEIVAELGATDGIFERIDEVRPDVVIIDLQPAGHGLAARIAAAFPRTKVIACSSDDPMMRVFPPFHHGESYAAPLNREHLAEAARCMA